MYLHQGAGLQFHTYGQNLPKQQQSLIVVVQRGVFFTHTPSEENIFLYIYCIEK